MDASTYITRTKEHPSQLVGGSCNSPLERHRMPSNVNLYGWRACPSPQREDDRRVHRMTFPVAD
jgi:hypothetical protein